MKKESSNALYVILFTIFLDLVGIGILIPVIPQLLANPDSPEFILPASIPLQYGYVILGALVASYPLAQFFAAPLLGQLSDRYGRRPVLIISILGTALGYALFAIGIMFKSLPLLFFARTLDGITGGNLPVAQAAIADVSAPEHRSRNFGLMGGAFGLGFIIGPYLGGQLADDRVVSWFTAATPFWFAAILAILNAISIAYIFPETRKHISQEPLHWAQSLLNVAKAWTDKKLRPIYFSGFLFQSGFSFFTTLFGVFLLQRFGFTEAQTGNFFAYIGVWIVIWQIFATPRVAKLWKERIILNVTFIGTALVLLLFNLPGSWIVLLFIVPIFSLFNGLTQANFSAFLSRSAGPEVQGEVMGINASITALSQAIPPVFSGLIASRLPASATIYIASSIMLIAWLLFVTTVRNDPKGPMGDSPALAH